jgi:hypothetical protein
MSNPRAAGRKTETPRFMTGDTEHHLQTQIAALTGYLEFCLEQARAVDPADDCFGHARSAQVSNAIALAKMSTKLGLAMARMQGEVSYNFNYNHNPSAGRAAADAPVDLRLVPLAQLSREVPAELAERRRRYKEVYDREWAEGSSMVDDPPPSPETPRFE